MNVARFKDGTCVSCSAKIGEVHGENCIIGNSHVDTLRLGGNVREFSTGATRSPDADRPDYEGYLSPLVIERYGEYMLKNQIDSSGNKRDGDNWQKGMPLASYMKGMWRHFMHLWARHRGWPVRDQLAAKDIEEDLCAILFNAQGYLHETLKSKLSIS